MREVSVIVLQQRVSSLEGTLERLKQELANHDQERDEIIANIQKHETAIADLKADLDEAADEAAGEPGQ